MGRLSNCLRREGLGVFGRAIRVAISPPGLSIWPRAEPRPRLSLMLVDPARQATQQYRLLPWFSALKATPGDGARALFAPARFGVLPFNHVRQSASAFTAKPQYECRDHAHGYRHPDADQSAERDREEGQFILHRRLLLARTIVLLSFCKLQPFLHPSGVFRRTHFTDQFVFH